MIYIFFSSINSQSARSLIAQPSRNYTQKHLGTRKRTKRSHNSPEYWAKRIRPPSGRRALGRQDEAKAASGQGAYRGTRAIINVPFTSAESSKIRAKRGKERSAAASQGDGAKREPSCGCASRTSERASVAVCFARAGGNESPR